jgi:hypothetical protein
LPSTLMWSDRCRRGYDMHTTIIRNEHAYYCCATQLLEYLPRPVPLHFKPIYMVGELHIVALLKFC